MAVLPPANGEKRWRIKRAVSVSGASQHETNSSLECLNNSLKISAAGKMFMTKRPPMKRPRAKPGMPKDFVFVDLSPIKSEEESGPLASDVSATSSPIMSCGNGQGVHSPMSLSNDSISSAATSHDDVDYTQYNNLLDDTTLLGLGLMNINYDGYDQQFDQSCSSQNYNTQHYNTQNYENVRDNLFADAFALESLDAPAPPLAQTQTHTEQFRTHKRHKSASSIPRRDSAGGFQFKPYKGPLCSKKPQHSRKARSLSLPSEQILAAVQSSQAPQAGAEVSPVQSSQFDNHVFTHLQYSPVTDASDDSLESLMIPAFDFESDCFGKDFKEEFDLNSFIAL